MYIPSLVGGYLLLQGAPGELAGVGPHACESTNRNLVQGACRIGRGPAVRWAGLLKAAWPLEPTIWAAHRVHLGG